MADFDELIRLMRDLEDRLVSCMRCGLCQAVCPLFSQTGREADVARGKLALLDGLLEQMLTDPQGVLDRLNKCLLCGSCAANCPSGVDVLGIFMQARAILTGYMGLAPTKRILLRGMLSHPQLFDRIAEWGARFQGVFTKPVNGVVGTSCARFNSPLLAGRHFKPLAAAPFHRRPPTVDRPAGASGLVAGFFVGCLLDKIFPEVAEAVLTVFDHHGVGVVLPANQACCGIPSVSSGDLASFQRLVRRNVALFDPGRFDVLVTACATCTATIKHVWPKLIGRTDRSLARRVHQLADRTMDISQLLVSRIGVAPATPQSGAADRIVTYHDPCHLKKSLGVGDEPRRLLAANPAWRLMEMARPDDCCGMGGSFNLQYYELSSRIGRAKRDQVTATGCQVVATGCPACMLQIGDMLSQAGERIAVKHTIELYAEALPGNDVTAETHQTQTGHRPGF
jgi:glycolate oxidase iron-sulfur subunit